MPPLEYKSLSISGSNLKNEKISLSRGDWCLYWGARFSAPVTHQLTPNWALEKAPGPHKGELPESRLEELLR